MAATEGMPAASLPRVSGESTSSTTRLGTKRVCSSRSSARMSAESRAPARMISRGSPSSEFAGREHLRNGHGGQLKPAGEGGERALRRLAEVVAVGHLREAQQVHHGDGVAGGLGAIVIFLHAQDEVGGRRRRC